MNDLDLRAISESLKILSDEIPSNLKEIVDSLDGICGDLEDLKLSIDYLTDKMEEQNAHRPHSQTIH